MAERKLYASGRGGSLKLEVGESLAAMEVTPVITEGKTAKAKIRNSPSHVLATGLPLPQEKFGLSSE